MSVESWHLRLGTERTMGRERWQWAHRMSRRSQPSFDAISGDIFFWKMMRGVLGTPGTELLHKGPGSPLLLSSCGPALGWNQECSKE